MIIHYYGCNGIGASPGECVLPECTNRPRWRVVGIDCGAWEISCYVCDAHESSGLWFVKSKFQHKELPDHYRFEGRRI